MQVVYWIRCTFLSPYFIAHVAQVYSLLWLWHVICLLKLLADHMWSTGSWVAIFVITSCCQANDDLAHCHYHLVVLSCCLFLLSWFTLMDYSLTVIFLVNFIISWLDLMPFKAAVQTSLALNRNCAIYIHPVSSYDRSQNRKVLSYTL